MNVQLKLAQEIENSRILSKGAARETPGEEKLQRTQPCWNQFKQLTQTWKGPKDFYSGEILGHTMRYCGIPSPPRLKGHWCQGES